MADLKYPLSDDDRIGDAFIKFSFFESIGSGGDTVGTPGDGKGAPDGVVDLYIPNGFQLADQIQYQNSEFGLAGELIQRYDDPNVFYEMAAEMTQGARGGGSGGVSAFVRDVTAALTRSTVALSRAAAAGVGGDAFTGGIGLRTGKIWNPNLKATFRGVDIRSYTFTFNMVPTSVQEAEVVRQIVQKFRSAAYPDVEDTGGYNLFLKYPQKVDVVVYPSPSGEEGDPNYQIRFKPSFITNMSVTRNPTSTTYHSTGAPVETQMTVTLTEQEVLTKRDIEGGF
jgi:hypothetical protein